MSQRDIDRAVARATGETVGRVHQMGFTLVAIPRRPMPRLRSADNRRTSVNTPITGRSFAARHAAQA